MIVAHNSFGEIVMSYQNNEPRASDGQWSKGQGAAQSDRLQAGLAKAGAKSRGQWKRRTKGTHSHTTITGSRPPVTAHAGQKSLGTHRSRRGVE